MYTVQITEGFVVPRNFICILQHPSFAQNNPAGRDSHKTLLHGPSAPTHLLMSPVKWSKPGLNLLLMKEKEEDTLRAIISSQYLSAENKNQSL